MVHCEAVGGGVAAGIVAADSEGVVLGDLSLVVLDVVTGVGGFAG